MVDIANKIKEKLESLNESSIWTFAKQHTDFERIFKATCIFDSINDKENVNIENYFNTHSLPDGFNCNHRMLSSAQLFGLLTKNASSYSKEVVTPVFLELKKYKIGSKEFNLIKSEQLLKIKISAIIDRSDNNNFHQILPIFFIFDVLYKLNELGIDSISLGQLFTYVMTCSRFDEVSDCVECLLQNPQPSVLTDKFENNCRMWTLITKNCKLFKISESTDSRDSRVSINPKYLDYFYNHFYMNKNNVINSVLNSILDFPEAYKAALTTIQGFNIDLTEDSPKEYIENRILTSDIKSYPLQIITYGAPGTGKSHEINLKTLGKSVIRTTFHPDSDYSTFVGAYKPVMEETEVHVVPVVLNNGTIFDQNNGTLKEKRISYKFVKQAFIKAYLGAWKKFVESDESLEPQFLIIEEINRGNCAQIFGDLFQLLDRNNENNFSTYPINADTDLQKEIERAFKEEKDGDAENPYKLSKDIEVEGAIKDYKSDYGSTLSKDIQEGRILLLPPNLYIWATMNTSDQSLFPIDSAFKRRWDWKYVPIDTHKEDWSIFVNGTNYDWCDFLDKINDKIYEKTQSEDKMLGFYFCKAKDNVISADKFVSKVLFYLWNDVFKDYGFDDSIFNDDNGKLAFHKFYINSERVNEVKIERFLNNLGVKLKDESNDYSDDDPYEGVGVSSSVKHKKLVSVSFPDGTMFSSDNLTRFAIFKETLKKINLENVLPVSQSSSFNRKGFKFVSNSDDNGALSGTNYSYVKEGNFYILKGANDDSLISVLIEIKNKLNLDFEVKYN